MNTAHHPVPLFDWLYRLAAALLYEAPRDPRKEHCEFVEKRLDRVTRALSNMPILEDEREAQERYDSLLIAATELLPP